MFLVVILIPESVLAQTGSSSVRMIDGADVTKGAKGDSAASSGTGGSWTLAALLRGSLNQLITIATNTGAAIPAGTAIIGKVGIDQTTPGTTNGVAVSAAPIGGASGGTILSAASNNSTSIKASAGTLYSVTILQTTTTLMDVRFYDTGSAPTCSSATSMKLNFVAQSSAVSAGATYNLGAAGIAFPNGIGVCITGANANNDNTNAATGLNLIYAYQ